MESKSLKYVFIIYFIIILSANIGCMIWANSQSFQYKKSLDEIEKSKIVNSSVKQELTTNKETANALNKINDSFDKALGLAKPFVDAGKKAEKATPIFIIGIYAGLFCSCITFIPSIFKKAIDEWVMEGGYLELDWDVIVKYEIGIVVTNLLIVFFQFMGAKDFLDFGSIIASAFT